MKTLIRRPCAHLLAVAVAGGPAEAQTCGGGEDRDDRLTIGRLRDADRNSIKPFDFGKDQTPRLDGHFRMSGSGLDPIRARRRARAPYEGR